MNQDATLIKQRLVDHYDKDAKDYHAFHYARWGEGYSPLQFRQRYIEAMIRTAQLPKGAKILDVGCGPGELLSALASEGHDVWGIDISSSMVQTAQSVLSRHDRQLEGRVAVGDIERLAFDSGFFDVVVASGVLEYQKNDTVSLTEMARALRPGGYLILNVTNRYGYLNWFDEAYRAVKRRSVGRRILNFLKETVLRKGKLGDLPERRTHRPRQFDETMAKHGLEIVRHNFFHFSPLPTPFDDVFSSVCKPAGRRMESLTNGGLAPFLAGGYIVMARKRG